VDKFTLLLVSSSGGSILVLLPAVFTGWDFPLIPIVKGLIELPSSFVFAEDMADSEDTEGIGDVDAAGAVADRDVPLIEDAIGPVGIVIFGATIGGPKL
jgi:hypothetical protein